MTRGQQIDEVAWMLVGVLVFVHEDELEPALVLLPQIGLLPQQLQPADQQIVEVHHIGRPFARRVTRGQVLDLRDQRPEVVVLLLDHRRHRLTGVDRQREDVAQHVGLGKPRRLDVDLGLRQTGLDQVHARPRGRGW